MKSQKYVTNSLYVLTVFAISTSAWAANLYRYNDENGVTTMSRTLPAEIVPQGYDIIDDKSMRLIKRVPPAMSETEITEKRAQLKQQREAEEKQQRQQQADQRLLESYNSELDLIRARDAKIDNIQRNIDLAAAREEKLNSTLYRLQQKAADQELSGQAVNASLTHKIATTHEEINVQQNEVKQQTADMKRVTAQFDADHQRLKQLLNQ